MVPVVSFSAAPIDAEEAKAKATIPDSFSFMRLVHKYRRWCDINETQDIFQALRHSKCLGKIPEDSPPSPT
jgi:hypothetical protein